jgi:hypothetical protein
VNDFGAKIIPMTSSQYRRRMCFEAVAVLVQYKMEMGEPLFDI